MSWARDLISWARDLMSWARDLMSWERDNNVVGTRFYVVVTRYIFFNMSPQCCRTNSIRYSDISR